MLFVASGKQWQREKSEEKGDSLYEEVQVCGKFKVKVILKYNFNTVTVLKLNYQIQLSNTT